MKKLEPDIDDEKDYGPDDIGLVPPTGVDVPPPKPRLRLIGTDGNAFAILGAALNKARECGWSVEKYKRFKEEATSGNYDQLLATVQRYFDVH